jgi:hypothetical protein
MAFDRAYPCRHRSIRIQPVDRAEAELDSRWRFRVIRKRITESFIEIHLSRVVRLLSERVKSHFWRRVSCEAVTQRAVDL